MSEDPQLSVQQRIGRPPVWIIRHSRFPPFSPIVSKCGRLLSSLPHKKLFIGLDWGGIPAASLQLSTRKEFRLMPSGGLTVLPTQIYELWKMVKLTSHAFLIGLEACICMTPCQAHHLCAFPALLGGVQRRQVGGHTLLAKQKVITPLRIMASGI